MCVCHGANFVDTGETAWEGLPGIEGAHWKVLRNDPLTGGVQALLKFPVGAIEPPHHHSHGFWVYVQEGAKMVENLTLGKKWVLSAGMYLYTPSPHVHRVTYLSRCTLLFVTDGAFDVIWDTEEKGVKIPAS
jgi:quercetin dioxygenase-like cupin family protein